MAEAAANNASVPTFSWEGPGNETGKRIYYKTFKLAGTTYNKGDHVYLLPEEEGAPLYIARCAGAREKNSSTRPPSACPAVAGRLGDRRRPQPGRGPGALAAQRGCWAQRGSRLAGGGGWPPAGSARPRQQHTAAGCVTSPRDTAPRQLPPAARAQAALCLGGDRGR